MTFRPLRNGRPKAIMLERIFFILDTGPRYPSDVGSVSWITRNAKRRTSFMLAKLIRRIFQGKPPPEVKVLSVTAPRTEERSLSGVENFLRSIGVPEPFSLEIVGDAAGVSLLVRCREGSFVKQQLGAHHRHAQISEVAPEDDPLLLAEGERAWSTTLRLQGPEYLPLRTFDDDDLREPGSDPLISVIGGLSDLQPGERVAARLSLTSLEQDWARPHQDKLHRKQQADVAPSSQAAQYQAETRNAMNLLVLAPVGLAGLMGYLWVQRGETWKAVLLGLGVAAALVVAGWAWWRIKKARAGNRLQDPLLIQDKLSRPAFQAQLEIIAVLPEHGTEGRAGELLRYAARTYQGYDNIAGARFKAGKVRPAIPATQPVAPAAGLFRARNVLGVRELAALWHPLGAGNPLASVHRSGSRVLQPAANGEPGGAHVGNTGGGRPRPVRFGSQVMGQHHLYLARTRMGKSTLMRHIVAHQLAEKAAGRNYDAVIVIDPHSDLVNDLLQHVPREIVDQVYLIDLADETRAPGINLLDVNAFPDRDRAADAVVRGAKGVWEQWGPRMQSILEHVVKTLHEYNSHPDTGPEEQLTILDGSRLMSDRKFRRSVLRRVKDPFLIECGPIPTPTGPATCRPTPSPRCRPVWPTTPHPRRPGPSWDSAAPPWTWAGSSPGWGLLVSTAQGPAGPEVSSLVGVSILNLVDSAIRAQGTMPPEFRRGVLVVVDEMQALPGVDYEGMLSELGKFGASFILATQSLTKLDEISDTMRDTLLANVGCLVAFQVSATDARELMGELDRERVGEEDIVSLPSHHCYVRATVDGRREPTYYMELRSPEPGDPQVAQRIRDAASAYTRRPRPWPGWRPRRTGGSKTTGTGWNGRTTRTPATRPPAANPPTRAAAEPAGSPAPTRARLSPTARAPAGGERAAAGRSRKPRPRRVRPGERDALVLRTLAVMPFLDWLELAAVSGLAEATAHRTLRRLEAQGLVRCLRHASPLTAPPGAGSSPPGGWNAWR